jgi:uncharacterized protein YrrD
MKMTAKNESVIALSGLGAGLLLCLLAIFGLILTGCSRENVFGSGRMITEERAVSPFNEVTIDGSMDIVIEQGPNVPLIVEAEDNVMRYVETYVSGTTLRIKMRNGLNLRKHKQIRVQIQSEDYRRVVFSGSGSITAPDTIRTTQFTAELNGSGDGQLKVDANEVRFYLNGSGNIRATGKARDYFADISGSGNIQAQEVKSVNADVRISGSGNQAISVTDNLKAKIAGSGNIRYWGNPAVNVNITGSGKVIKQ